MFGMVFGSAKSFFQGRLFADNGKAFGSIGIGIALTAALFLIARKLGITAPGAAGLAGLIGGAAQPFLLRNVKYR
ncbi:MAG TPA: hypothetical protein VH083_03985 [Myxococcales bacterium]|jgi:hypothetical protein|nr:hypothetical protein [Myxococcales bacterium]